MQDEYDKLVDKMNDLAHRMTLATSAANRSLHLHWTDVATILELRDAFIARVTLDEEIKTAVLKGLLQENSDDR